MSTKLSHSSVSKFIQCPKAYQFHYIDRIRSKVTHAALIFGSAIDSALNELLTQSSKIPEETFEEAFTQSEINSINTYIPTATSLVYSNNDFDDDLLINDDYNVMRKLSELIGNESTNNEYLDVYKILFNNKKESGFDSLTTKEKEFYNLMNWLSLRRKGFLMIDAYRKKILPRIERVLAIQEYVSIDNADGDKVVAYVDLIADIKDLGVCILDNKTSAMEYETDSVLSSSQLSLYVHMLEEKYKTRKAGYIVMRKGVIKNRKKICSVCGHDGSGGRHKTCDAIINNKRCGGEWIETIFPEIAIQFIVDTIPLQTEKIIIENIDSINVAIKSGNFTRNLNTCSNYFGGKCPYFSLCYHNDSSDLINLKEIM